MKSGFHKYPATESAGSSARCACQHCVYYLFAWLPLGVFSVLIGNGGWLFGVVAAVGVFLSARGIWLALKAGGIHIVERGLFLLFDTFTFACAAYYARMFLGGFD